MRRNSILYLSMALILVSCSMTKGIPEDDQLFTGLTKIAYADEKDYDNDDYNDHLTTTKEEVEAALATEPNGSFFGSSYYTVPWSWHLWVYNKYSGKDSKFAKWMTKSFGKAPVLMSKVNPALRASVAKSVLQNNGYFRGDVTYEVIQKKNPKKCKIGYTVRLDSLFTLDSVAYTNFPEPLQELIDSTKDEAQIRSGNAFSVASLDGERSRVSTLFRNNGYYYYNSSYASYLADTFQVADKAQLRFQLADGLPDEALKKWYIGNLSVQIRKSAREQLTDSVRRRHLTILFNGKNSPVRPRIILKDLKLRPRQLFSYDNYLESTSKINSTGVFSSTDFQFTPRPDTDTLDVRLNCVLNKPYDFYIEANAIGRTNGRYGPEGKIGFTRRNLFRGGEKLDINLHGSYEWQRGGGANSSTFQYGADASIEFPRIIAPFYNSDRVRRDKDGRRIRRRRFYSTPTTYAKISTDIVRRPEYYKMHVVSGEWTYRWQSSATSQHEFSPLTVKYQYKNTTTAKYDSLVDKYVYLERTMGDYFIPKMRYTYTYTSPTTLRNPIRWETTIEESGNVISLYDRLRGKPFDEKNKELFKTPYSQFLRLETDLTKTWSIGMESSLVGHVNAGIIWSYGNSYDAPLTEQYYVGGANSIRAFMVRDIGPGSFSDRGLDDKQSKQLFYLMRNGDMKLVMNLEYRTPLFGNLKGAIFLDAGNVWRLREFDLGPKEDWIDSTAEDDDGEQDYEYAKEWTDGMTFKASRFFNDIALGTGVGLRYDLGFLVVRLDWGFALHIPCDNGVSGYFFNVKRFKDLHTLNFAIGYPF
ncbi:MAG: BamA/TamA family outer membrane protein [Prevotella sp.]|nr:BamA/TamA family outer membrane protein [Prevotella sp.]